MGVGRGGGGGETGFTQWEMLEVDTFTSDSRWKCSKFAVFLILGVFWGFVGHIIYDSSPPIKYPWRRPCKTSADQTWTHRAHVERKSLRYLVFYIPWCGHWLSSRLHGHIGGDTASIIGHHPWRHQTAKLFHDIPGPVTLHCTMVQTSKYAPNTRQVITDYYCTNCFIQGYEVSNIRITKAACRTIGFQYDYFKINIKMLRLKKMNLCSALLNQLIMVRVEPLQFKAIMLVETDNFWATRT